MANYRTRLRNIGCSELSINAKKEKHGPTSQGPNQVKLKSITALIILQGKLKKVLRMANTFIEGEEEE